VYKAEDTKLQRTVALKFLPLDVASDDELRQRFINEARTASALNHPNICTIYSVEDGDQPFIAMEFVAGNELREIVGAGLKPAPTLTLEKIINYATQIAEGLQAAHKKGVVHRDIKPANIMVTDDGLVKVMDFGLAKTKGQPALTKTGSTIGTIAYMSPEQARNEEVDHRSDIFSFGAVLYELCCGRQPFAGDYEAATLYSVVHEQPEALPAAVPAELQRVVFKCLEKEAHERYQSLEDMLVDLKALHNVHEKRTVRETGPKTAPGKRYFLYGAVVVLAILLFLAGRIFFTGGSATIDSIAVLPLENLSGETDQDVFAAGMHEALISELSKISALRTISRTSVMQYKKTIKTIPEIAEELDVDALVTGSAFRSGETVRITVQLMAARPEKHLWNQTFDRDLVDVLVLHSEVARQIASEIQIKVTQDEESQLKSAVAVNTEAYENYLLGRHYLRMGGETLWQAIEYFERAIALDSTFALGYAGLALAYNDLGGDYNTIAPEDTWPKVREYVAKALALNEGLAEAYTALALVKRHYKWDWPGAEREFKKAIELNPNSLEVLLPYVLFLADARRHDDAGALYEKIIKLDPNSKSHPIRAVFHSGRVEDAIQLTLIEIKSQPEQPYLHWRLALWYTEVGKYDDAIKHLKIQIPLMKGDEVDEVALLGNLYGRTGRRAQALEMLERLDELSRQGKYVSPALKAWVYSGLNDRDEAILWLTKGYEARAHRMGLDIIWVKFVFEPIADDPRFKDLLRKMNLEPW